VFSTRKRKGKKGRGDVVRGTHIFPVDLVLRKEERGEKRKGKPVPDASPPASREGKGISTTNNGGVL